MNTKTRFLSNLTGLLLLGFVALGGSAFGQSLPQPSPAKPLTAGDAAAFFDGMIPSALAAADIAGATLTVVKDGRVLLSKGYGLADVNRRTSVSADQTLFRPGSISKLFTWTAVMQQVEAGRLDLDADINSYLDFKIPEAFGKPITLRHLMTHTAGFQEHLQNLMVDKPDLLLPLDQALKASIPARIYPPGQTPAYSNYGASLAGYIVQRVSGMPFAAYVEKQIFRPLGMSSSTFHQPLPPALQLRLAKGYNRASGEETPFEFVTDSPAGALTSTGPDMARFMIAHLNQGALPGQEASRILKPETVRLMHSVANRPAPSPGINAMAYGFYEENLNGLRVIAHGGDTVVFHSDLHLILQAGVGLFVSFNSAGKDGASHSLRQAIYEQFMDRYFPGPPAAPFVESGETQDRMKLASGPYQLSRRVETNLFSFFYLFGQTEAKVTEDGALTLDSLTDPSGVPKKFRETAPWFWQDAEGKSRLTAVIGGDGKVVRLVGDWGPIFVFEPVPSFQDKRWILPAWGAAAVITLLAVLGWPVGGFVNWRRPLVPAAALPGPWQRGLRWASRLSALATLGFFVLLAAFLGIVSGGSLWLFTPQATGFLTAVQGFALLSVLATVGASAAAVGSWMRRRLWRALGRTLLALACAMAAYMAVVFHFLQPLVNY